jgi:hypothetical protein
MAHGYSLVNCEYYIKENLMHPLIKRMYTFLRQFKDSHDKVYATWDIKGIPLNIFVKTDETQDNFYTNVSFNGAKCVFEYYTLNDLQEFTVFLETPPYKITAVQKDKWIETDVTNSIGNI